MSEWQSLPVGCRVLVTKMLALFFARGSSPSTSASGLPPPAAIYPDTKCACVARNKWWARQDLNLGPIDYESTALTN